MSPRCSCEKQNHSWGLKAHLSQCYRLIFNLSCNATSSDRYFRSRNVTKATNFSCAYVSGMDIKPMEAKIAHKRPVILHQNRVAVETSLSMETEEQNRNQGWCVIQSSRKMYTNMVCGHWLQLGGMITLVYVLFPLLIVRCLYFLSMLHYCS